MMRICTKRGPCRPLFMASPASSESEEPEFRVPRPRSPRQSTDERDLECGRMINYHRFYSEGQEISMREINFDEVFIEPEVALSSLMKPLLTDFNTRDYDSLVANPSPAMQQLADFIHRTIDKSIIRDTVGMWPPKVASGAPEVENCVLFIVSLLNVCGSPETLLRWVVHVMVPERWHDCDSIYGGNTRAICLCHMKRKWKWKRKKTLWAEMDNSGFFTLYLLKNGKIMTDFQCKADGMGISTKKRRVSIVDENGVNIKSFEPIDSWQGQLWTGLEHLTKGTPAPFFMATSVGMELLPSFLPAVYQAITANDMFVLRTLVHFSVTKLADSFEVCNALIDIFAHAGKMTQLLFCLADSEFSMPTLTTSTILRSNSNLSSTIKLFFERFASRYTTNVLLKLAKYIDGCEGLSLIQPQNSVEEKVRPVIFTVLKHILRSGSEIPPEIRHIASILRSCATARFNEKLATYSTLSGFFNLRYICPFLADPAQYTSEFKSSRDVKEALLPFSNLLMQIFNRKLMTGRYEVFSNWNTKLSQQYFPDLMNFVLSIGDCEDEVVYQAPSEDQLRVALLRIVKQMSISHEAFFKVYNEVANSSDYEAVVKWELYAFFNHFFSDNIEEVPCVM